MVNTFAAAILDKATTIRTENGDLTYSTSLDSCVDLFFKIGAIRGQGSKRVIDLYDAARRSNEELATRIMLWARDARGGAGERQIFRDFIKDLQITNKKLLVDILPFIPEVGRWDDLFVLDPSIMGEEVSILVGSAIQDFNKRGLVAKWMPSEGSKKYKNWHFEFLKRFELSPRSYRKLLSILRNVVETKMCAKDWQSIVYEHVPSVANVKYAKAFKKHDEARYSEFLNKATTGETKINAGALFPYDIYRSTVDTEAKQALWDNLPNFIPDDISFLPIVDTSASMGWTQVSPGLYPFHIANSLALYMAERNKSAFKNIVMPFADRAEFVYVNPNQTISQKIFKIKHMGVGGSTNLDSAFDAILTLARKHDVSNADMPKFLIIFSDMEFNRYSAKPASERLKDSFKSFGYDVPTVVWWNIQSRGDSTPVRFDESGMVLVSGASPAIVKNLMNGDITPMKMMLNTVMVDRYNYKKIV